MKTTLMDNLIANLNELTKAHNLKLVDISKKSGVTVRMIQFILERQRTPTLTIIEKLASAFKLEPWQLLMPNQRITEIKSTKISNLVDLYIATPASGRAYIEHVAEREANYSREGDDKVDSAFHEIISQAQTKKPSSK